MEPLNVQRLAAAGLGLYFRPCDAAAAGIGHAELRRLERLGVVEREVRGLYRQTRGDMTQHDTVAAVCAKAPRAIVCLRGALQVYEIGTQKPREVWIAIPRGTRVPAFGWLPVRVTRFSGTSLEYGVVDTEIGGVPTKITTPARTVVDCFRFWKKIGLEPAVEALHEALYWGKTTLDEIRRAAEVCRARSLIERGLTLFDQLDVSAVNEKTSHLSMDVTFSEIGVSDVQTRGGRTAA